MPGDPAVRDTLSELRAALSRYAASFDAALLSGAQADATVACATAIVRMATTIQAKAAARRASTRGWKSAGERSAASHLAHTTGSTVAKAVETLATARRLENLPVLDAAASNGDLSAEQTAAIADAATADPGAEARLVERARQTSLPELVAECARTKAAAVPDLEARRREIHARRSLRDWTDADGVWHLRVRHNPEVGAQVMAALAPLRDRVFAAARSEGRREPLEAYAADALVGVVCGTDTESRPRAGAKVIARVDLATLLRGHPLDGETCEIAGFGPVAVSAVRDLMDTGDPFLAAVATSGEAVVGVAHLGRRPRAVQRTALEWLYPTCAAEGCTTTAWLENDHRLDWADSHITVFDLLDRLCSHHHHRKTLDGWALVDGRGKRAFVSPGDPRHPSRAHDPPSAA